MTALPTRREATPSEMEPALLSDVANKVCHLDGMIDELCRSRHDHNEKLNHLANKIHDLRADVTRIDRRLGDLRLRMLEVERQCDDNRKKLCTDTSW